MTDSKQGNQEDLNQPLFKAAKSASNWGNKKILAALDAGAQVNATDSSGRTPLDIIVEKLKSYVGGVTFFKSSAETVNLGYAWNALVAAGGTLNLYKDDFEYNNTFKVKARTNIMSPIKDVMFNKPNAPGSSPAFNASSAPGGTSGSSAPSGTNGSSVPGSQNSPSLADLNAMYRNLPPKFKQRYK